VEPPIDATPALGYIIEALKTYGAVVGTTSTDPGWAEIDLENVAIDRYNENILTYHTWDDLGIGEGSLSSFMFDDPGTFFFSEKGGDGPTHQEWENHGEQCESDPGQ
jgi:hypothetical protein